MNLITSTIRQLRKGVILALDPLRLRQELIRRSKSASLEEKIMYDAMSSRPHFAYGVYSAAKQAKALGFSRITVIEFGCAGGNGLIELENISHQVNIALGVQIDIFGFDMAEGLPKPLDYRDLPYAWKTGQFKMDIQKLEARLKKAKLVIGDVADTISPFRDNKSLAPIGFVSFDLDYYTSTVAALKIFNGGYAHILPRVFCYFDDCIGPDNELHSEFAGELLAIKEFNERDDMTKLTPINGFSHKRIFPAAWNDMMYVLHSFSHPLYGQYITPKDMDMNLALE